MLPARTTTISGLAWLRASDNQLETAEKDSRLGFKGKMRFFFLESEDDKLAADFVFLAAEITRPITAPPGISADVAASLRKAFDETMIDPSFLADARMANILISPMNAEEVSKAFESLAATPNRVLERAKMAVTTN